MKLNKLAALALATIGVAALSTGCMTHEVHKHYSPEGQLLSEDTRTSVNNPSLPHVNLNVLGNQEIGNNCNRRPAWSEPPIIRDRPQGVRQSDSRDCVRCYWLNGPAGYGLYWWDDRAGICRLYPNQF